MVADKKRQCWGRGAADAGTKECRRRNKTQGAQDQTQHRGVALRGRGERGWVAHDVILRLVFLNREHDVKIAKGAQHKRVRDRGQRYKSAMGMTMNTQKGTEEGYVIKLAHKTNC